MSVRRSWLVVIGVAFVALSVLLAVTPEAFGDVQYRYLFALLNPRGWAAVYGVVGVVAVHVGYLGWREEGPQRVAHALVTGLLVSWAVGVWLSLGAGETPPTAPVYLTALAMLAYLFARSDLDAHREHRHERNARHGDREEPPSIRAS